MVRRILTCTFAGLLAAAAAVEAQSLRGSRVSVNEQNRVARQHDFTFLRTPADVRRFAEHGYLVPVRGNRDYALASVSFPYARPEVRLFLERLGQQYRAACGEQLVVTSLTRPLNRQPPNASPLSVHPAGMAVDLRISQNARCRRWLESTLLSLDRQGVLNATRERRPPHYHVAVYPQQYRRYVQRVTGKEVRLASGPPAGSTNAAARAGTANSGNSAVAGSYTVRRGDSLWGIARRNGTTVDRLMRENGLRSASIQAGQTLNIPAGGGPAPAPVATTYRVARGDSLWTIARRHGTTVENLKDANGLRTPRIYAGQVLRIPAGR